MNNRQRRPLAACLAAACVAALAPAHAADNKAEEANPYQALIDNSPFLTPAFKARLGQRDIVALSFVGYTLIGEEWYLAIVERKGGKTLWLKLNVEQEGIKVERFDEAARKIHLTVGGIGVDLELEQGK